MSQLLSQEELIELTGSPQTKKQMEILSRHHIRFVKNSRGLIKTTWQAVNSALKSDNEETDAMPKLDWMTDGKKRRPA